MSYGRYASQHATSYPAPRGPVLLLSCMDLRLMDETVAFMDLDGLTNRYDHVILAGAALGAQGPSQDYEHWWKTFKDHLDIAYQLRQFKDVYILEHRDCGAYKEFLGEAGTFNDDQWDDETDCHRKYALKLRKKIEDWDDDKKDPIRVRSFLMDLRGRVELLDDSGQKKSGQKKPGRKKRK